jgi:hypothetical protein
MRRGSLPFVAADRSLIAYWAWPAILSARKRQLLAMRQDGYAPCQGSYSQVNNSAAAVE